MIVPTPAIPFFGVNREYEAHRQAILNTIDKVLSTGRVLQGEAVNVFEQRISELTHRKYAIAVGSCTDALYFAMNSLGIGQGDEVLVTDFSFVASASAILRAGAKPVFVDIDDTYNMDLDQAAKRITQNTRAMIYVHLFGKMGNPQEVEQFAKRYRLKLVEDAAQALGASHYGRYAGSLGKISCISFDPTKVVSAPGSGGIVLTDDPEIADHIRKLRYHGRGKSGQFEELGYNSQMPTLTAAVLNCKLDYQAEWLEKRCSIARNYIDKLKEVPVIAPNEESGSTHIYHKFVIRTQERDNLRSYLQSRGIETMVHYSLPFHKQPLFAHLEETDIFFSQALEFARSVLSLPIHPFLSKEEVDYITKTILSFFDH